MSTYAEREDAAIRNNWRPGECRCILLPDDERPFLSIAVNAAWECNHCKLPRSTPREGWDWGPWRRVEIDGFGPVLLHQEERYEIPIAELRDPANALDWIAQMQEKGWDDHVEMIAGLIAAIDDLANLRRLSRAVSQR